VTYAHIYNSAHTRVSLILCSLWRSFLFWKFIYELLLLSYARGLQSATDSGTINMPSFPRIHLATQYRYLFIITQCIMLLSTARVCSLTIISLSVLLPSLAQADGTAEASINPTATNVALATQAVAQLAQNGSNGILGESMAQIPGFIDRVDDAIKAAVAQTVDQLNKILHPELYYSYGRSPPVYPTRK
jgi:hypothetical protein